MSDLASEADALGKSVMHMQQHVIHSMSAEIKRLREREALWERCAQKTVEMYGGCVRPEYEKALEDTAIFAAGLVRLTDEEREAIEVAANWCETPIHPVYSQTSAKALEAAEILRCLLVRCAIGSASGDQR